MPAAKKAKSNVLDFPAEWQIKGTTLGTTLDVGAYDFPSPAFYFQDEWTIPGKSLLQNQNFSGQVGQYISAFSVSPPVPEIQGRLGQIEGRLAQLEKVSQRTVAGFINTLADERLELRKPVAVTVEFDEDGYVVARWTEALLEGEGRSQLEAISELRAQIVEAYLDAGAEVAAGFEPDGYPKILWTILSEFVSAREARLG